MLDSSSKSNIYKVGYFGYLVAIFDVFNNNFNSDLYLLNVDSTLSRSEML